MERHVGPPAKALPVAVQWGAILFALTFPSVFTWVYFVGLAGHADGAQQVAYNVGKAIQFLFPAVWVLMVERRRLRFSRPTTRGLALGIGMGLVVAGIMFAVYFGWLAPRGVLDDTAHTVRGKLAEFGIDSPSRMIGLGIFYSLLHSLLEEYYWRWFTFGQLRRLVSLPVAIVVSSVGFMGHHVIVLWIYLPQWAVILSICIGVGGGIWAWLYERSGSLYAPWVSHLLIDAAIFAIGYHMAFAAR